MKVPPYSTSFKLTDLFLSHYSPLPLSAFNLSKEEVGIPITIHPFHRKYIKKEEDKKNENKLSDFPLSGNWIIVLGNHKQLKGAHPAFLVNTLIPQDFFPQNDSFLFPLYHYDKTGERAEINFNTNLLAQISDQLFLEFLPNSPKGGNVCFAESSEVRDEFKTYFTASDLLDYLYAVFFIPITNERIRQPIAIPFPKEDNFWTYVHLGTRLRKISTSYSSGNNKNISIFPSLKEENKVINIQADLKENKVRINDHQYFYPIAREVWDFQISGYFPAREMLEEKLGKSLDSQEVSQFQQLISNLSEMIETIEQIRKIEP